MTQHIRINGDYEAVDETPQQIRAAGILFLTPEGRALFVRRSKAGDHSGEWALPGGKIEDGETAEEAARREAHEETGHVVDGELTPHYVSDGDKVHYTTFRHDTEQFEPELDAEHTDAVWRGLDNVPEPLHPGVRAMFASKMAGDAKQSPDKELRDAVAQMSVLISAYRGLDGRDADELGEFIQNVRSAGHKRQVDANRPGAPAPKKGSTEYALQEHAWLEADASIARIASRLSALQKLSPKLPASAQSALRNAISAVRAVASKRGLAHDAIGPEKRLVVEYSGDANLVGLIRTLQWLGSAGASRTIEIAAEDRELQAELEGKGYKTRFGWDGDGADKIWSAEINGEDILKKSAEDADCEMAGDAKLPHSEVNYGQGKPEAHCGICEYFRKDGPHCKLVVNPIQEEGWCKLFDLDQCKEWLDKPADYVKPTEVGPIEGSPADPDTPRFIAALTGTPEIDRILEHPLTRALLMNPVVDRSHTEPYMAGASEGLHDPTVYIDEHVPHEQTVRRLSNRRAYVNFDPAWFWIIHEDIELLVMLILIRGGMTPELAYKCAHYLWAEPAEEAAYRFFDIDQKAAEKEQDSWEPLIQKENADRIPHNLYRKPYPHGHVRDAARESTKFSRPTNAEAERAYRIVRASPEFIEHAEFKPMAQDEFKEGEHPRDSDGKFKGGGSGGASAKASESPEKKGKNFVGGGPKNFWKLPKEISPISREAYEQNIKMTLANPTYISGNYRGFLGHLYKQSNKYGTLAEQSAVKDKLIDALQKAKVKAEKKGKAAELTKINSLLSKLGIVAGSVHEMVKTAAHDIANKMKYPLDRLTISAERKTFMLNGRECVYAGGAHLYTGKTTLYPDACPGVSEKGWRSVMAHEVTHHKFEALRNAYDKQNAEIFNLKFLSDHPDVMESDGATLKPEFAKKYPVYQAWTKIFGPSNSAAASHENTKKLIQDDGVSSYSREYWKSYKDGKSDLWTAVHETLAEMSSNLVNTGQETKATSRWKKLYDLVEKSWEGGKSKRNWFKEALA